MHDKQEEEGCIRPPGARVAADGLAALYPREKLEREVR
jgi:hypothetical protein